METSRSLPTPFMDLLSEKPADMVASFHQLRAMMLEIYPEANELLYSTHALVVAYSLSDKMKHTYCHLALYSKSFNLGFNKGTLLDDVEGVLHGSGKLIRHIPITSADVIYKSSTHEMIMQALAKSLVDLKEEPKMKGQVISKLKG